MYFLVLWLMTTGHVVYGSLDSSPMTVFTPLRSSVAGVPHASARPRDGLDFVHCRVANLEHNTHITMTRMTGYLKLYLDDDLGCQKITILKGANRNSTTGTCFFQIMMIPYGSRYVLRIRDFPCIPMTWGWDFSTINPTNFREGSGFLGHVQQI